MHRKMYEYPLNPHDSGMEINNHYPHIPRKDISGPTSPLSSPIMGRRGDNNIPAPASLDPLPGEIMRLKQYQQVEQQRLMEKFQAEQQHLQAVHEKQIEEHLKVRQNVVMVQKQQEFLEQQAKLRHLQHMIMLQKQQEFIEQQKKLEEQARLEQKRMEEDRIQQIKHKAQDEQSAIASTAVKQKLQEFVLNKKQREAAVNNIRSSSQFRWAHHSSFEQSSPPQSGLSPPYRPHLLGAYDDDFQLRRTASEPNLKVRSVLKQKVIERRSSPLIQRRNRTPLSLKRKPLGETSMSSGSTPDSGPNSPPSSGTIPQSGNGSLSSLHSREEVNPLPLQQLKNMMGHGSYGDLTLYASPSMPNISLGRPPTASPTKIQTTSNPGSPQSEAEVRAMAAARLGLPLTGHMLPNAMPIYHPALQVADLGSESHPTSPAYINAQMKMLEQMRSTGKLAQHHAPYVVPKTGGGITDSQVAQARLHRHRPLGRTQSAPLPLGHPLLNQPGFMLQQQHEQFIKENHSYNLKQHIRQQVLQRAGSKNHMENVDEEAEAKLAQEMKESRERDESEDIVIIDKEDEANIRGQLAGAGSADELEKHQVGREAFLSHNRELIKMKHHRPPHRPLSRTQSSPLVTFSMVRPPSVESQEPLKLRFTTGIVYDTLMLKHQCSCGNNQNHPEHAGRLQSIYARLQETGLVNRCEKVKSRKATIEELQSCHSEPYTLIYGTNTFNRQKLDSKLLESFPAKFCMLPCGGIGVDSDTVWNDMHTSYAARMAAGSVTELALKVASGELKNGIAVVRPPGHHAEFQQAMGFCYFNSIAIAAKQVKEKLKMARVLILDWDVHHGNGTQQAFYNDPEVMYISLHRHDNGNFFPGTGAPDECGDKKGAGYTVNVAFTGNLNPPMSDAEYMAAFRTVVMPIAREFNPDVVLVSSGFDAAKGHAAPLGGYTLSAACFGHMTKQLMCLAGGKVVLVLEGGYDLPAICDASELCTQALLGDEIPPLAEEELSRPPAEIAVECLNNTIKIQAQYWPCVTRYQSSIGLPLLEVQKRDEMEREENDTVSALASLSMVTGRKAGLHSMSSTDSEPMEEDS